MVPFSETMHNMIVMYGTHIQNDNISRHFFHFFKILIFWVHREVKRQKTVQNDKKILFIVLHISGTMHIRIVIYGTCVEWWYLQVFSSMFQKFEFPGCQGVKRQKLAKNDKQFCASCLLFQEPYIIWSLFMVHICKRIISPGIFFIFSKYRFSGSLRG